MLKINLLPIRQLKKRAKARNQLLAAAVVFICVLALLALVGVIQAGRVTSLEKDIAEKQRIKKSFDKVVQELAALEKERLDLNNKIKIINRLKTDSSLTVRVLDEVAKNVDQNRMWLTRLSQQGSSMTLSGFALDNQTVATFMDALTYNSPYINGVNLTNSSLSQVSGKDLKSFTLTCGVSVPPKETDDAEAKTEEVKK